MLQADVTHRWTPPWPLDPRATLAPLQHGPQDPSLIFVPDGVWRAVRAGAGSAAGASTVRLRWVRGNERAATAQPEHVDRRLGGTTRGVLLDPAHGDHVEIQAWGPGAATAAAAVPAWLGTLDDWTAFDSPDFTERLPEFLRATRRLRPGLRLPSGGGLMDTLVAVVLEQRVTGLEAHSAWARLLRQHGEQAPGPAVPRADGRAIPLFLPPKGAAWRRIPSWQWHAARVDPARRNTIVAVAERESAWARLEAERPAGPEGLPGLDVALSSLRGVGVWSVAETLQRTHGAPDHVSFGDFHVAHHVGQALSGRRVDDAGMEALLAPFAGQRQRVVRLIGASGAKNPSFGPRLAPQDHRGH